ncbi:MAG: hypothetical protein PHV80_09400, partial [Rugosibacter sp.]|nr:hypothetical protein [Rugosibacter sp.]
AVTWFAPALPADRALCFVVIKVHRGVKSEWQMPSGKPQSLPLISVRLNEESIAYFKTISEDVGIPSQSLTNL